MNNILKLNIIKFYNSIYKQYLYKFQTLENIYVQNQNTTKKIKIYCHYHDLKIFTYLTHKIVCNITIIFYLNVSYVLY